MLHTTLQYSYSSLFELNIFHCGENFSFDGLKYIFEQCKVLQKVSFSGKNTHLSDTQLLELFTINRVNSVYFSYISLQYNENITSKTIIQITQHNKSHIKRMNYFECSKVNLEELDEFIRSQSQFSFSTWYYEQCCIVAK